MNELKIDRSTLPLDGQKIRFHEFGKEEWHTGTFSSDVDNGDLFVVNEKTWFPAWDVDVWEPLQPSGIELIATERREQIEKHGYSIESDTEFYSNYQLIQAALFCIDLVIPEGYGLKLYKGWPQGWSEESLKKIIDKDSVGKLKVAGAFIAAEIDRLQNTEE